MSEISEDIHSFVGPLFHRSVLKKVGLPRKDYFIYGDDYEYGLRIRKEKLICLAISSAKIYHDLGGKPIKIKRFGHVRIRYPQQAWKFYYDTRNTFSMLQNLNIGERYCAYFWWLYRLLRSTIGDFLYQQDWSIYIYYRWLGAVHGILKKTGKSEECS